MRNVLSLRFLAAFAAALLAETPRVGVAVLIVNVLPAQTPSEGSSGNRQARFGEQARELEALIEARKERPASESTAGALRALGNAYYELGRHPKDLDGK